MAQPKVTSLIAALICTVCRMGGCLQIEPSSKDPLQLRARQQVWRLRRAYEKLTVDGGGAFLPELFARGAAMAKDTVEGLIVWVEFLEDLIQETENLYGGSPGKGEFKSAQVKAAMFYSISNSPSPLMAKQDCDPALLAPISDWAIDAVVYLLNSRGLWTGDAAASANGFSTGIWLRRLGLRIAAFLSRIFAPPAALDPRLKGAVDRILAVRGADPLEFVEQTLGMVSLLEKNRRQVVPLLELVASAASDAESFLQLDGPQKRAYACDLVLAFVEVEFDPNLSDAARIVLQSIVELLLDSVVMIFNKRAFFTHAQKGTSVS